MANPLKKADIKFLKVISDFIAEHSEQLGALSADLRDKFDNKGEKAQASDNGVALDEAATAVSEVFTSLEAANDALQGLPLWEDA